MDTKFTWAPFYMEWATKIAGMNKPEQRCELIQKVLEMHSRAGIRVPVNGVVELKDDVDPFSVFAFINRNLRTEAKVALLTAAKELFDLTAEVPSDFVGLPQVNYNRIYYVWAGEPTYKSDIENLWRLFTSAIQYADCVSGMRNPVVEDQFVEAFDKARKQKGVGLATISMGLFWVRPETFVGLDSLNRKLMYEHDVLPDDLQREYSNNEMGHLGGIRYLRFCTDVKGAMSKGTIKYHSIKDLSLGAFQDIQEDGEAVVEDDETGGVRVWLCAPGRGGSEWDVCRANQMICLGWDEIGDLSKYDTREAIHAKLQSTGEEGDRNPKNASLACWQFSHEMKKGDVVVAKAGFHKLLGIGVVDGSYVRDEHRDSLKNILPCKWVAVGDQTYVEQLPVKTLTDITRYPDFVQNIFGLYGFDPKTLSVSDVEKEPDEVGEDYGRERFLAEVFMSESEYDRIYRILMTKKNIILQGAPGVGKTFAAKRFAASVVGCEDSPKVEFVQFHQNYTYEDFIGGYKPDENGFRYRTGVFYRFCKRAKEDAAGKYFFIIDEINRGNLSKIFGELLMLIEADKRNEDVSLAYTGEPFFVPDNVYIIGMMNTADRSLAMIDYALRRRFSFITMRPAFGDQRFDAVVKENPDTRISRLIECVRNLNKAICADASLGEGFEIGHSYFCNPRANADDIAEFELKPMLREYWFDDPAKALEWSRKLDDVLK